MLVALCSGAHGGGRSSAQLRAVRSVDLRMVCERGFIFNPFAFEFLPSKHVEIVKGRGRVALGHGLGGDLDQQKRQNPIP